MPLTEPSLSSPAASSSSLGQRAHWTEHPQSEGTPGTHVSGEGAQATLALGRLLL